MPLENHESVGPRLRDLVERYCDQEISAEECRELEQLLHGDPAAKLFYAAYMQQHAQLQWGRRGVDHLPELTRSVPRAEPPANAPGPNLSVASRIAGMSRPAQLSLGFASLTMVSILLTLAQISWVSEKTAQLPSSGDLAKSTTFVARLVGEVDCRWNLPSGEALFSGQSLRSGRVLDLREGAAQLAFKSGGRLTLQGPVRLEVQPEGVHLHVGRVTAQAPEAAKGFFVVTATTRVVDLGTEFGVHADAAGATEIHVFSGQVLAESLAGGSSARAVTLSKNEALRITSGAVAFTSIAARRDQFMKWKSPGRVKRFNLAETLAGGDGFGRGITPNRIHPLTGEILPPEAPLVLEYSAAGPTSYRPVEALRFVDGVFIPDGGQPVVLDGAEHTFDGFPLTDRKTWLPWSFTRSHPTSATLLRTGDRSTDFAAEGNSALYLHANRGICFDLQAIREATGMTLLSFHAEVGNASTGLADYWVFVDGKLRAHGDGVTNAMSAHRLDIPLDNTARFLTLAATDHGDSFRFDQILFGNPRLLMLETAPPPTSDAGPNSP